MALHSQKPNKASLSAARALKTASPAFLRSVSPQEATLELLRPGEKPFPPAFKGHRSHLNNLMPISNMWSWPDTKLDVLWYFLRHKYVAFYAWAAHLSVKEVSEMNSQMFTHEFWVSTFTPDPHLINMQGGLWSDKQMCLMTLTIPRGAMR